MKKLMIAAAIVCAAVASQAATFSWTYGNVYDEAGTTKVGNTYKSYLFTTATKAADTWASITTADALATALDKGYKLTWSAAGNFSDSSKTVTETAINAASALGLTGDTSYKFYAVTVNAAGDAFYVSNVTGDLLVPDSEKDNLAIGIGSQQNYTDKTKTSTYVGWTTVTPEPTSGLLLLIGVAGLALRRRRA